MANTTCKILTGQKSCNLLVHEEQFYEAISSFKGASKRLQLIAKNDHTNVYLDFAHSPSKLMATVRAVKEHFPKRQLIACMELHTFSSLTEDFLGQYYGTMERADKAYVYFNQHALEAKKMKPLAPEMLQRLWDKAPFGVYRFKITDRGT